MKSYAIIGTGIAGMAAAWLLHRHHHITIYEKNTYLGGHAHTVDVDYYGTHLSVDTGFMVYNDVTYPHLKALFRHLDIALREANLSFGVSINRGSLEYANGSLRSLFTQHTRWVDPLYHKMLYDILRFNRLAPTLAQQHPDWELSSLLDHLRMGAYFRNYYLLPLASSIWNCPHTSILKYSAQHIVQFLLQHGLMQLRNRPSWCTITGGSREYVKKLCEPFLDRIFLNRPVRRVLRQGNFVRVEDALGESRNYDGVIFATHSDEAVNLIGDITDREMEVLGAFRYHTNEAILHHDVSFMPHNRNAWASCVYLREDEDPKTPSGITYWMNRIQHLDARYPLFVTLNPPHPPEPSQVFSRFIYHHPVMDANAMQAQERLNTLQGDNLLWFCGSYHGNGFHEDALRSGIEVANRLGAFAPWQ